MEEVRSFVAIELPDKLKEELRSLEAQLKSGGNSFVKWVDPQSIHLTLKFLGNVPSGRLDDIVKVLEGVVAGIPPFHLEVKELGVFPNLRRLQVIWVGLRGNLETLRQLQKRVESALIPLGFPVENRDFTPHLTLGRVREGVPSDSRERLGKLIAEAKFEAVTGIEVSTLSLMRSQLTRAGAIYSRISLIQLKGVESQRLE